jgi:hypothetical protein
MTQEKALQALVDALEKANRQCSYHNIAPHCAYDEAIQAGKQAIAELESQEPVAWIDATPLYTHPPQRTEQDWDALAEKQLASIKRDMKATFEDAVVRATHKVMAEFEAQPKQEPVAWRAPKWSNLHGEYGYRDFDDPVTDINGKPSPYNEPLYTHPQRTWVGLTDEEIDSYFEHHGWSPSEDYYPVIKAIEAKLKEKNT